MADLRPADYFLVRAPLLPASELAAWREAALARTAGDDDAYRRFLAARLASPLVRDAIALASPALAEALEAGIEGAPRRVVLSFLKYFARMATRPTPFGLFSGYTIGRAGNTAPRLGAIERMQVQLDGMVLDALGRMAAAELAENGKLRYATNGTVDEAAGRLHYIERTTSGDTVSYALAATSRNDALDVARATAQGGATKQELVDALVAALRDVTAEDAGEYVDALVDGQILLADVETPILRRDDGVAELRSLYADAPRTLSTIDEIETARVAAANGEPLAPLARRVLDVAGRSEGSAFHVQTRIAAEPMTLGSDLLDDVARACSALHAMFGVDRDHLHRFRRAFEARYDRREVPLLEALDSQTGLGSDLGNAEESARASRPEHDAILGALVQEAMIHGTHVTLSDVDVERLRTPDPYPLPENFSALFALAADGGRRPEVVLRGAGGPPAIRLMARFASGDAELREVLRNAVRDEESALPGAIVAEVVHVPSGHLGNVIHRAPLRDYEIAFFARPSVDGEHRLPLQDLHLSLVGDRLRLRSRRLDREVVPRLTSAHNLFRADNLGLYRLLGLLSSQQVTAHLSWRWGALTALPFLPRVKHRNVVLSRARWLVRREEARAWSAARSHAERSERIGAWRATWRVPQFVTVNELLLDLENPDCLELLPSLLAASTSSAVEEAHPHPGNTAVEGPGGAFLHEIDLPLRNPDAVPPPPLRRAIERVTPALPGGEWLFASIFCSETSGDDVIRLAHDAVVAPAFEAGIADRWFVVRYADPEWHIRLRLRGDPARLRESTLGRLHDAVAQLAARGLVWRLQLDTYEPEVERYGGPAGFAICEEWFHRDSDSAIRLLDDVAGLDQRERVLLVTASIHDLLGLFALSERPTLAVLRTASAYFRSAAPQRGDLREHLARQFRAERELLGGILYGDRVPELPEWVAPLREEMSRRRPQLEPLAQRLAALARDGKLLAPLHDVVIALLHMHANRVLAAEHRTAEVLIYDLLERSYLGRVARNRDDVRR